MTEAATNASGFEDQLKQKDAIIGQKDGMIRRIREDAARSSKEVRITKTMDRDHLRSRTDRQREKAPRGRRGQGIPERARVQGKGRQDRGLQDLNRLPCLGARRRESMVKDEKIDNYLFQHYPLNRRSWGYLYTRRNRSGKTKLDRAMYLPTTQLFSDCSALPSGSRFTMEREHRGLHEHTQERAGKGSRGQRYCPLRAQGCESRGCSGQEADH